MTYSSGDHKPVVRFEGLFCLSPGKQPEPDGDEVDYGHRDARGRDMGGGLVVVVA